MSATPVLDRLDKVKQTGPDRWIACCPAHDDKSPSLAVRELDDGRILLHDFGGAPMLPHGKNFCQLDLCSTRHRYGVVGRHIQAALDFLKSAKSQTGIHSQS